MKDYTVTVVFDDGMVKEKTVRMKRYDKKTIQSVVKEFEDMYPDLFIIHRQSIGLSSEFIPLITWKRSWLRRRRRGNRC